MEVSPSDKNEEAPSGAGAGIGRELLRGTSESAEGGYHPSTTSIAATDDAAHPDLSVAALQAKRMSMSTAPINPSPLHTSTASDSALSSDPSDTPKAPSTGATTTMPSDGPTSSNASPNPFSLAEAFRPAPPPVPIPNHPSSGSNPPHSRRPSSQFQSTRPAPPSPAPSRRASQIYSPSPGTSFASGRDRASSTSSAGQSSIAQSTSAHSQTAASASGAGGSASVHRKLSTGSGFAVSRNSSKARPRSSLGTAMYTGAGVGADEQGSEVSSPPLTAHSGIPSSPSSVSRSGLATAARINRSPSASAPSSLPHSAAASTPSTTTPSTPGTAALPTAAIPASGLTSGTTSNPPSTSASPVPSRKPSHPNGLVIRDYAFPSTDDRFHGLGQPQTTAHSSSSRLSSFLQSVSSRDAESSSAAASGGSVTDGLKKGWSNFSLLGWRGFMGGRKSRSASNSDRMTDDSSPSALESSGEDGGSGRAEDVDADSEPDFHGGHGQAEDDYAFESSSEDDEEPYGLYRAAYAFEAEGEHEISVEEGEVVEVKGRGGGDGWVVAVKLYRGPGTSAESTGVSVESGTDEVNKAGSSASNPASNQTTPIPPSSETLPGPEGEPVKDKEEGKDRFVEGLVPEGYLEKVDDEELRIGMIHAGYQYAQRRTVAPDGISEEPEEASDLESGPGR